MEPDTFLSFLGASILLTLSPGPDILLVITSSSAKGFKTGFAIATGLCSGLIIHSSIVAFGATGLLKTTPWIFWSIKVFGAGYLLWLSYQVFRSSHRIEPIQENLRETTFFRLLSKGFLMNILNPKVTLFFLAFLPQFIPVTSTSPLFHTYFLSFIFFAQALLIFTASAYFSGRLLGFIRQSETGLLFLKWAQIVLFVAISAGILLT